MNERHYVIFQAQQEAKEEAAKLKRKSMDIEKQMKAYIEEKEKFNVEREQERNRIKVGVFKLKSDIQCDSSFPMYLLKLAIG